MREKGVNEEDITRLIQKAYQEKLLSSVRESFGTTTCG